MTSQITECKVYIMYLQSVPYCETKTDLIKTNEKKICPHFHCVPKARWTCGGGVGEESSAHQGQLDMHRDHLTPTQERRLNHVLGVQKNIKKDSEYQNNIVIKMRPHTLKRIQTVQHSSQYI